jgi:hypothetical protein
MSQASASSLPFPVARPRISANRHERGARQAHEDVGPCLKSGRALRDAGQILEVREEVGVIEKEAVDGTFEDHHLHSLVVLERRDDLSDLHNEFRTHEAQRRVVEDDSTV